MILSAFEGMEGVQHLSVLLCTASARSHVCRDRTLVGQSPRLVHPPFWNR
jgi:hypothetical protein